jgi:hypothetical protein
MGHKIRKAMVAPKGIRSSHRLPSVPPSLGQKKRHVSHYTCLIFAEKISKCSQRSWQILAPPGLIRLTTMAWGVGAEP